MVAYLQKLEGSEGFHQIIDFLNSSHIQYTLTENPTIYVSFIKQFWRIATARTSANREVGITATIDRKLKVLVTEASIRRPPKLEDSKGLKSLHTTEFFEQLALIRTYPTPTLTHKLFSNMKRISKGYSGVVTPLFNTMLVQHQDEEPSHKTTHESSPSRITSSPSLSPQTHPSTSQPQTTFVAEEPALMPHESPLQSVHSLGRDEGSLTLNELMVLCTTLSKKVEDLQNDLQQTKKVYSSALTKLILRVKKLEKQVKTSKARRRVRLVLSEDEDAAEDSSKQGRKISEIDTDPSISLVQDEGPLWFQEDGSGEKGEKEVSTVGAEHSTVIPEVSTATSNLVYIRRSAEKRKDKRKAIMREDESVQKKTKKQLEQERLSHETAIRLQEQIDEEERKRIARDAEIAKQLQEEYDRARQEQEVVAKDDQAYVIDWSDLAVIRYHAQQNRPYSVAEARKNMCIYLKNQGGFKMSHFKGMSYDDIRPIFERVWDQNQSFVPMDSEKEKGSEKKGSRKKSLARKKATEKQSEESTKKQKIKDDIGMPYYHGLMHAMVVVPCIRPLTNGLMIHSKSSPLGSDEGSKQRRFIVGSYTAILRVKKVEKQNQNKQDREGKIVISEDEDAEEDSSKQGKKIFKIDKDPTISLVQPEQDMEYDFDVSTTEGFTTASVPVTTASATPEVSTAAENLVYIRRSAKKRKDKGKAIMKEDEFVQKKTKKQLEKERLGHEEAMRLQEQINEEERQRIARDAEIAKQLQEEFDRARQEQEVVAKADQAHDIDWSDPAVLRYHAVQNRSFSKAEILFEPNEEDEIWKNQQDYNLISWRLFDSCGIHMLLMHTGVTIHMMIEKKYPLTQEMLSRMLSRRLEVDQESEMEFELSVWLYLCSFTITVLFIILLGIDYGLGSTSGIRAFALRNFDLEVMKFESAHGNTTAKLPILKLGEYEMWVIRIKQYFQIQDYALWEVIENVPVTAEEKTNKKNDVKARSLLLMALPNEHQLTFSQYPDAKTIASSTESLDSIFNRLQKIVSRLAILGVVISQEDLNLKILSSLHPEWNTQVVVWMNKPEIETMSIDDLYNNFKIVGASSGAQNLAFMTAPSTSSTNDVNTAIPAYEVSTASPNVNAANPQQDLEQIHEDDLEAMDLKWQLSLLSMRAKRYYQWTGKKIFINANDTARYDKSKVECFNCHKLGHFARECRASRNKEGQFRNQGNTKKQGNNEDTSSKAMLAIDGVASKDLDKLLGSQITDKSKKGLGYNAVPPPHPLIYNRHKQLDFSYFGLDEFKAYGPEVSEQESNVVSDKKSDDPKENSDESLVEEQVSKDTSSFVESSLNVDKETVFPVDKKVDFVKPKNHEKPVKKSVRYAEMYRSQTPRGNQRNWNGQKSNQLGRDFVMYNKACFICESFNHLQINYDNHQRKRTISRNNYNRVDYDYYAKTRYPSVHRNMTPRAVLLKTGLTPLNVVRPVNTAHPKPAVHSAKSMSHFSKQAQSTAQRPFYKQTTLTRRSVHTAKRHYYTERPRAGNTARSYIGPVNPVRAKGIYAVKTSACKPQQDDTGFVDSGCSRHMTGNIAYLSDFKEFDRGYVTFGGGAHGGRISGKGTFKTDSLDFEDVYSVNELKFNIFSVSQMCDKKNYVLFTDTEYLVLSPNFKLPDENQILLKIPRKDNMYSFDMKNIVPKESLTCLVAKAILDESMLWHRRLSHINFKNINKLVNDNLNPKNLPLFDDDKTNKVAYELDHKAKASPEVEM
ncbi:ribonuclease H-like domain-containing protein [Tanacetum coccineum]|uniref:Ribonuclease H-like domain-containing protein n=1 Tax=Tanacetum coccineum TaxID=301880 RepID=A0ABQ4ZWX7_9ASTR